VNFKNQVCRKLPNDGLLWTLEVTTKYQRKEVTISVWEPQPRKLHARKFTRVAMVAIQHMIAGESFTR
jgi:hypothetical protein